MSSLYPPDTLHFPPSSQPFLEPYLPPLPTAENTSKVYPQENEPTRPFTTLTFATSLDSSLSLAPGVGTAIADNPGLNCRIEGAGGYEGQTGEKSADPVIQTLAQDAKSNPELKDLMERACARMASKGELQTFQNPIDQIKDKQDVDDEEMIIRKRQEKLHQPRPIIIDPKARWVPQETSKIIELVRQGRGKAPFVIIAKSTSPPQHGRDLLEKYGGKFIALDTVASDINDENGETHRHFDWHDILHVLATKENIRSIMIEGGGSIINSLLSEQKFSGLIDSVIVTIAPTWLGQGGVVVSPKRRVDEHGYAIPASRLTDVKWYPFGEDVVLCGRIQGLDRST
ncbi:riboflavin biosynthesis protein Rib7, putative [Talaromyces stipitatus ATCC 10500]|uniref:2,5-diamino-6-ribosylamino-4(3H)-pyrimidinone 5'-phosphate reductase n=1 Tax=Talaromyces stipitatus (strain ATCC 10500 / CBS 375.48 / QM 6759 / NRRL 1006) TaxID=441959 RepID=B8MB80_TALSN|nr:riboflavin biosynthesis protein Rib7, putative [Talaromyces stipitatus ATCC 10500]EED18869.1 riboflavin biosynthesis protein Rib7, putative [Talaromyces stipitatus ATCC 10500]